MKIAILTLPLHRNYGGILQAYALQTILSEMGHDVFLFDEFSRPFWREYAGYVKRFLEKHIFRNKGISVVPLNKRAEIRMTRMNINRFIQDNFKISPIPNQRGDLDAIIVGSDQVWRPLYFNKVERAFLDFAKDWEIVRIAYACSFGTDKIEYTSKQMKRCGYLIQLFDAVSVREKSAIDLIVNTYKWLCCPKFVLDPTMLMTVEKYRILINTSSELKFEGGGLFYYFLDKTSEKMDIVNEISKKLMMNIFDVSSEYGELDLDKSLEKRIVPSIESWLMAFDTAKYIVTDSFHGCVFSILFNKPFIVYGNYERGLERFISLLDVFQLRHRLVNSISDLNINLINETINWERVNDIVSTYRQSSLLFLTENLK